MLLWLKFGGHRLEPTDTSAEGADLTKAEELWRLSEQLIASSTCR